jgi:F0F1-type ATP synthase membrane subunit b/b'
MEHTVSNSAMIVNLLIQVGQIAIFFGIFVYVYGSNVADAVHARQAKELKLANADAEYDAMIAQAQKEKGEILASALTHKQSILSEAENLAQQKIHDLIAQANHEADQIKADAEHISLELHTELVDRFESMVKKTAHLSLHKLM